MKNLAIRSVLPVLFKDEQSREIVRQVAEREGTLLDLANLTTLPTQLIAEALDRLCVKHRIEWTRAVTKFRVAAYKGHLPEMLRELADQ